MVPRSLLAVMTCFLVVLVVAAEPVPVETAHGKVVKTGKDTLTFQPREAAGKFGKDVTLKVTGTSRITMLAPQTRDKKLIMTQKDADVKDLTAGQLIAVIYATPKGQDPVLLSAVVQAEK